MKIVYVGEKKMLLDESQIIFALPIENRLTYTWAGFQEQS